jgi:putative protease
MEVVTRAAGAEAGSWGLELGIEERSAVIDKPKILSPVASLEGAVEVIAAGADEIYCAVQMPGAVHILNRPEYCCVPTYAELGEIAAHARDHGVEAIVTLELPFISAFMAEQMRDHIASCVKAGIDALIVGDVGLIRLIKEMGLDIPVYASTLLTVMNYRAVDFLRELGVERVILERHISVEEIAQVVQHHQDLEIEVFVHGQGCSNINVNCYLEFARASPEAVDKAIGGVKGMVIPCRLPFEVFEYGDDGQELARLPILDAFTFCSMCRLPELIETGVMGLKIVGRCLSIAYQVQITRMYRELVDLLARGRRGNFNRVQRRRFSRKVEALQEGPFRPESQRSDGSSYSPGSLREILCQEKRCYYAPLFHAPYRASRTSSGSEG